MFDLVKNWYRAKVSAYEQQVSESNMMARFTKEAHDLVTERPDGDGFTRTDQVTDREKGHLQSTQLEMVRRARMYFRWEPNARAALQTLQNYIMGKGISITPKSKEPILWWIWREFWTSDRNRMQLKQFEIPLRLFRDGEVFIEFFSENTEGLESGKTTIRFLDPLLIKNPGSVPGGATSQDFKSETTKSGIEHDTEDVENTIAYWVESRKGNNEFRRVPAERVLHIKVFSDSDQKRGESFIQPVMNMFTNYRQWLDNRIILNKMRSAIVLIRKVEGTNSQVQSIVNNLAQASRQRGGDNKRENIRGGTILTANQGVSYEMLAPNINANDVKEDGRNIKLNVAAGTSLPEYIFGDASNANFASSLIAESPFVKAIQFWQTFLEYYYCEIFKRVVRNAEKAGLVKSPDDMEFLRKIKKVADLTEQDDEGVNRREKAIADLMPDGKMAAPSEIFFGCDIQWPEIIHRNVKEQTEALQLSRASGWIADSTASQTLGYEYSEEVRKQKQIEDAAKKTGDPLLGVKPEDAQAEDDSKEMDDELEDMLSKLNPQQRQAVLDAKTPQDAVRAMAGAINGNGNGPQGGNEDA